MNLFLKSFFVAQLVFYSFVSLGFATKSEMEFGDTKIKRIHYASVTSTQPLARERINEVTKDTWIMISADQQEGGKGRWGRSWVSRPGNVFVSYGILFDTFPEAFSCSFVAPLGILDTLREFQVNNGKILWPNNVLVQEKKIAGILCSSGMNIEKKPVVILGIGLNVGMEAEECGKIDQPATSIKCELQKEPEVEVVLKALTKNLHARFKALKEKGKAQLLEAYKKELLYVGEKITFATGAKDLNKPATDQNLNKVQGFFTGINNFGMLELDGKTQPTGEIVPKKFW